MRIFFGDVKRSSLQQRWQKSRDCLLVALPFFTAASSFKSTYWQFCHISFFSPDWLDIGPCDNFLHRQQKFFASCRTQLKKNLISKENDQLSSTEHYKEEATDQLSSTDHVGIKWSNWSTFVDSMYMVRRNSIKFRWQNTKNGLVRMKTVIDTD
jgi:hypothetical protein